MNTKRIPTGRPAIHNDGFPVVTLDAVALLSGVNFGTVEKVFAALIAIQSHGCVPMSTLVKFNDMPLERVLLDNPRDQDRAIATRKLCEDIANCGEFDYLDHILKLRGRFPAH